MTCACGSRRSSTPRRIAPQRNSSWPNSARTEALGLDFAKFWTTYDNWKTGILNYFDGRYTSAAVEGINNKARVITKRCYGVKSADTLWNRLLLDLNRASEAAGRTIAELREIVRGLKAEFLAFCT